MDSRIMGEIRNDPSMDEILASIKRIIAEDGATAIPAAAPARPHAVEDAPTAVLAEPEAECDDEETDEVLELTQALGPNDPEPGQEPLILSLDAAAASQQAVATLSSLLTRSKQPSADQTLDGIVRELLRPMLQQWLDAHLPGLVEEMVQREIKRITGQS